jgi:hypothetical protein
MRAIRFYTSTGRRVSDNVDYKEKTISAGNFIEMIQVLLRVPLLHMFLFDPRTVFWNHLICDFSLIRILVRYLKCFIIMVKSYYIFEGALQCMEFF